MGQMTEYEDMETFFRVAKYPLVKFTDMNGEMKEEAMDICITAVEKYAAEMEKCTHVNLSPSHSFSLFLPKLIKDTMDKKFGPAWHVVVGEGFASEITYEVPLYIVFCIQSFLDEAYSSHFCWRHHSRTFMEALNAFLQIQTFRMS